MIYVNMTQEKKRSGNPLSAFLAFMGVVVVLLTFWNVFTAPTFSELHWLLLAEGVSLGITEIAVAWLIDIHIEK